MGILGEARQGYIFEPYDMQTPRGWNENPNPYAVDIVTGTPTTIIYARANEQVLAFVRDTSTSKSIGVVRLDGRARSGSAFYDNVHEYTPGVGGQIVDYIGNRWTGYDDNNPPALLVQKP